MDQSHSCEAIIIREAQLVEYFLAFYGTQLLIIVFTRAYHWSMSGATWIQSSHLLFALLIKIKTGTNCLMLL
jgi:hypothetical protein